MTNTTVPTAKTKKTTDPKVAAAHIAKFGSVSGAIRGLFAQGMSRGDIATALGKRYQHVRNVLITPVKNPKVVTPVK